MREKALSRPFIEQWIGWVARLENTGAGLIRLHVQDDQGKTTTYTFREKDFQAATKEVT